MTHNDHTFDAIVVGSGISGGWAAKELCEKGLKTLVLERGRDVKHGDYPTAMKDPWDMPNQGKLTQDEIAHYPKQTRAPFVSAYNKHFVLKDTEHNYEEKARFDWTQGNQVGGRSILWGRQCYRMSDLDFNANKQDGHGVDWPIRYADLAGWYDYVEKFTGISGEKLGLPHLPDGQFQKPWELRCIESHLRDAIKEKFNRYLTVGRVANLTEAIEGRGPCQARNRCKRGCPFMGYFSSITATLPAAAATGNMTLMANYLVDSVIYSDETQKAIGVRVVNQLTLETSEYFAKVIFLNASALNSTAILLNSRSERFPNGMGNDSGQLGRNLMDHHFRVGAKGDHSGYRDQYYKGRRPTGFYIARFRNLDAKTNRSDYVRGFGYQGIGKRHNWNAGTGAVGIGADFKNRLMDPGGWYVSMTGFGEILPYEDNTITLDHSRKDKWGQPIKVMDATCRENEFKMRKDMKDSSAEMLEAAGFKNITTHESKPVVGAAIHEMGTARMGRDPKTSVLNAYNQIHEVKNVYVTDGACMTSGSCQNPSITYMALTARAVDHAVKALSNNAH